MGQPVESNGAMKGAMSKGWKVLFVLAAVFNFAIGIPIVLFRHWTFDIAFRDGIASGSDFAPQLWADFGVFVILIGVGYLFIAADPPRQRMLVWLGVLAKGFDVVVLSWRTWFGIANPIVLVPAAIDGVFMVLFLLFLNRVPAR